MSVCSPIRSTRLDQEPTARGVPSLARNEGQISTRRLTSCVHSTGPRGTRRSVKGHPGCAGEGVSVDRAERRATRSGWASSGQVRSEQHGKAASGAPGLWTQMEKLALPRSGSRWFSEWNRRLSWGSSLLAADRGVWGPASISQARGRSPYRNLSLGSPAGCSLENPHTIRVMSTAGPPLSM